MGNCLTTYHDHHHDALIGEEDDDIDGTIGMTNNRKRKNMKKIQQMEKTNNNNHNDKKNKNKTDRHNNNNTNSKKQTFVFTTTTTTTTNSASPAGDITETSMTEYYVDQSPSSSLALTTPSPLTKKQATIATTTFPLHSPLSSSLSPSHASQYNNHKNNNLLSSPSSLLLNDNNNTINSYDYYHYDTMAINNNNNNNGNTNYKKNQDYWNETESSETSPNSPRQQQSSNPMTPTMTNHQQNNNNNNNNHRYYTMSIEELNPPTDSSSPKRRTNTNISHNKSNSSRHHYHNHPAGRALQGRLQRARSMQRVLSSSGSLRGTSGSGIVDYASSGEESMLSHASSLSTTAGGYNTNIHNHRRFHRSLSSKYSTLSNVSADGTLTSTASTRSHANSHTTNQEEFEATLSNAAIWTEIDMKDPVLCTALSRTKPSLSKATPPIYLAIGTASGMIQIQELLQPDLDVPLLTTTTIEIGQKEDNIQQQQQPPPSSEQPLDENYKKKYDNQNTNKFNHKLGRIHSIQISGKVRSIDFSTDGKFLAAGGDDGTCSIFSLQSGNENNNNHNKNKNNNFMENEEVEHFLQKTDCIAKIHRIDRIYAVQFSPDNAYLAIGGFDGTVAIISTKEFTINSDNGKNKVQQTKTMIEPITEIPRDGLILTIDWSPDSRYLAIGGSDKCCAIVNVAASWKVYKVIRRTTSIQSVQWYPGTGKYLAIASSDVAIVVGRDAFTTISEIDLRPTTTNNNNSNNHREEQNHDNSPNNNHDRLMNGRSYSNHNNNNNNNRSVYRTNAICWSPNGSYFVVCGSDRKCTILETHSFTAVHEMIRPANITCVVWGQQNQLINGGIPQRYLAIGGEDKKVIVLKAGIEVNHGTSSMADDYSNSASSSHYSNHHSEWVLKDDLFRDMEDILEIPAADEKNANKSTSHNPTIAMGETVTTTETNATTASFDWTSKNNSTTTTSVILDLTFSKGSKSKPSNLYAYSTLDGVVTIRYVNDWKMAAEIQFTKPIQSLTFSNGATNQFLVLGSIDSNVYISDTINNYSIIAKIELTAPVTSVVFSKNNERLAVGSEDGTFAFFDPNNNFEFCGEIEVDDDNDVDEDDTVAAVLAVDWSSKNMAIGRSDGTVAVYDAKQLFNDVYDAVANITRKAAVHSIAFGVSSRFLAVGGADQCVGIYSSKGSWVLCHQVTMTNIVASVRWSPVGRYLACGSADGILKVIDTIFWADVEEASEAVLSTPAVSNNNQNGNKNKQQQQQQSSSCLGFSQDGKFLAFASADHGMSVLNSSTNWSVDFRLTSNSDQNKDNFMAANTTNAAESSSSLSSSGDDIPSSDGNHHEYNHQEMSFADDYYASSDHPNSTTENHLCEV